MAGLMNVSEGVGLVGPTPEDSLEGKGWFAEGKPQVFQPRL
jgi:hypothetical protein